MSKSMPYILPADQDTWIPHSVSKGVTIPPPLDLEILRHFTQMVGVFEMLTIDPFLFGQICWIELCYPPCLDPKIYNNATA